MKNLNSLSRSILMLWYRSQPEEVKSNARKAMGLGNVFIADSSSNTLSTKPKQSPTPNN